MGVHNKFQVRLINCSKCVVPAESEIEPIGSGVLNNTR
jgi:hypothetical protein